MEFVLAHSFARGFAVANVPHVPALRGLIFLGEGDIFIMNHQVHFMDMSKKGLGGTVGERVVIFDPLG